MCPLFSIKNFLFFITLLVTLQSPIAVAYNDTTERRMTMGLRLFRMLLSSDIKLAEKTYQNNQLKILLVSANDSSQANSISETLLNLGRGSKKGKILGLGISISTISAAQLTTEENSVVAGIYIVDKLSSEQLKTIIDYGIAHHIIVYSPFEGDVQEGVLAGLVVGIRVLPFINMNTLEKSQISIKEMIFKVAKTYEE